MHRFRQRSSYSPIDDRSGPRASVYEPLFVLLFPFLSSYAVRMSCAIEIHLSKHSRCSECVPKMRCALKNPALLVLTRNAPCW